MFWEKISLFVEHPAELVFFTSAKTSDADYLHLTKEENDDQWPTVAPNVLLTIRTGASNFWTIIFSNNGWWKNSQLCERPLEIWYKKKRI